MLLAKILVRPPEKPAPGEIKERCTQAVDALEPLMGAGPGTDAASPPPAPDSETLFLLSRAYRCAGQDDKAQQTLVAFEKSSQNDRTINENKLQAKHLVQEADDLAIKNDFAGSLALLNQAIASIQPTRPLTRNLPSSITPPEKSRKPATRSRRRSRASPTTRNIFTCREKFSRGNRGWTTRSLRSRNPRA